MKSSQVFLFSSCEQISTLSTPAGSYSSDVVVLPNSCTINFIFPWFAASSNFNIPRSKGVLLNSLSLYSSSSTLLAPAITVPCGGWYLKNTWLALWGNVIGSNILRALWQYLKWGKDQSDWQTKTETERQRQKEGKKEKTYTHSCT